MIRRALLALLALPATAAAQDLFTLKPITKAVREGDEEKGNIAAVETLLKSRAAPDAVDREGYTSLLRAAEKGDVE